MEAKLITISPNPQSIQFYLISKDEIKKKFELKAGDLFYYKGKIIECKYLIGTKDDFSIYDDNDKQYFSFECYKVLVTSERIGDRYVKNKLSTHGNNNFYTTQMTSDELDDIIEAGGDCEIEHEIIPFNCTCTSMFAAENCDNDECGIITPKLKNGKIIFK